MTMQIIKPRSVGLISKTYGFGEFQTAIGGLSFFSLGDSPKLLMETAQWPEIIKALGEGQVLDMGFAKPSGEVLVAGSVYAAKGKSVTQMQARLHLGKVNKTLKIIGQRQLHRGWLGRITAAQSFSSIPMSWRASFGGPEIAENPLGCGSKKSAFTEDNVKSLPNFYYPKDSIKRKPKHPAGFGALDITWPQRAQYQGTYDDNWLKNIHPGFPKDTDQQLFCAAPLDQRLDNFIAPDAPYVIEGMHPSQESIQGVLPNVRIRVVVQQKQAEAFHYIDVPTHIDTLWLFPDAMLGVAIHRGTIPVKDIDGLDVKQLLLAYEHVDQPPKPLKHYAEQLVERTKTESALNSLLNEAPLLPEKTPEQIQHRKTIIQQAKQTQKARKQRMLNTLTKEQPVLALSAEDEDDDWSVIPQALLDDFDFDLTEIMQKTKALTESMKAKQQKLLDEAQALTKSTTKAVSESTESIYHRVFCVVNDMHVQAPEPPNNGIEQANLILASSQRKARQLAPESMLASLPLPHEQATQIRQWVVKLMQQNQSLAGRDLAGADLNGLDFSGQDLSQTMFDGCNLTHCRFQHCKLSETVFVQADIDFADFSYAKFNNTNLNSVVGQKVNFDHSTMQQTQMLQCTLTDCSFNSATLSKINAVDANFHGCEFSHASLNDCHMVQTGLAYCHWSGAILNACVICESNIEYSHWYQAKLHRCILVASKISYSNWTGAQCELVQVGPKGNLKQVTLNRSSWKTCGFRELNISQCDAVSTLFHECDFSGSSWTDSVLKDSTFYGSLMGDNTLLRVDWQDSLIYQTTLRKINATEVDWRNCTMREVDTDHGVFVRCRTNKLTHTPPAKNPIPEMAE